MVEQENKEQNIFNLKEYLFLFIRYRRLICVNLMVAFIVAIFISVYSIDKQFSSSIVFLPPYEEKSILSALSSSQFSMFQSTDISSEQVKTIFISKYLQRKIIERFNLYKKYSLTKSKNKFELAYKKLLKDLTFDVDALGNFGITKINSYKITAYHTSADTAYEMINYAFNLMDSMVTQITTERARKNREFIDKQLRSANLMLDTLQERMQIFQLHNKVFNISSQVQYSITNYSQLKAKILANELRIKVLSTDYTDDYPELISLKKENSILQKKLQELEDIQNPNIMIGLDQSINIFPVYKKLLRDLEIQDKLIILLTQQLEEAKLKEARDVSRLNVVDPAYIAEYKARPKRINVAISIFGILSIIIFSSIVAFYFFREYYRKSSLAREIKDVLKEK